MTKSIKAKSESIVVPFTGGKTIKRAYESYDKKVAGASRKLDGAVTLVFTQFIDACRVAGLKKDKDGCNALGKAITNSNDMKAVVARGLLQQSTVTNYAMSAKRAFFFGVDFDCNLFKDETKIFPWSTQKTKPEDKTDAKKTAGKSGAVETTTRDALMETLSKAIKQAALLNLTSLHDELLELADDNGFGVAPI